MFKKNILLLLFIAVAVVAIFAFIVASNKTPQQQNQTNLNNGKDVDTSDWQTYRNEEYGFEVKYPFKYIVRDYDKNFKPLEIIKSHNNPIATFTEKGKGDMTAYIEWWENKEGHKNFHKSDPDFMIYIKDKYIIVDYTPGVNYSISQELRNEWEKIISTFIIL